MIFALPSDAGEPYGFYELRGFDLTRATLDAGKAGKAPVYRGVSHQLVDLAALDHIYELMGMIVHLVVCGAGRGAFAATHTF